MVLIENVSNPAQPRFMGKTILDKRLEDLDGVHADLVELKGVPQFQSFWEKLQGRLRLLENELLGWADDPKSHEYVEYCIQLSRINELRRILFIPEETRRERDKLITPSKPLKSKGE